MITVQNRNRVKISARNQRVAVPDVMAGGLNSRIMDMPVSRAPAAISGRRRPKGVLRRSDIKPTMGSVTASNRRTARRIRPRAAICTPTTSV